jgi:hypothetical protein
MLLRAITSTTCEGGSSPAFIRHMTAGLLHKECLPGHARHVSVLKLPRLPADVWQVTILATVPIPLMQAGTLIPNGMLSSRDKSGATLEEVLQQHGLQGAQFV